MLRITELRLPLDHPESALASAIENRLSLAPKQLLSFKVARRGYDARRKSSIMLVYTVDCELLNEAEVLAAFAKDPHVKPSPDTEYRFVGQGPADWSVELRPRPVIIGFGPCGLMCALILAQMGLRPIVLERGKAVRERTKDTWDLWRNQNLHPESNVQFGEGGAGTFSDGKLWSQISDPRHLTRKVLEEFVKAGAPEEILYVSKPHIGTFRLVSMVIKMRAEIEALGGEIRFQHHVTDVLLEPTSIAKSAPAQAQPLAIRGLVVTRPDGSTETLRTDHVVLALGHSARDTFTMLHERGVYMEAKPFSIGYRIEHPQSLIDKARFGTFAKHPLLGAADYKLVHHARNGRSVYSFCMCPGGTVVAATSETHRVVTNGMSQYSRAERNANAGIVVGISPQDYRQDGKAEGPVSPLDGMAFQRIWESRAYELGGGGYIAPGALVGDFLRQQQSPSQSYGKVMPSYQPGVHLTNLREKGRESLPPYCLEAIAEALPAFEKQIPGFSMPDAVLTGVETRTSSPLRITRGKDFQSLNVAGLYPAGEGAGYAGGIMSAGVDGIEVAEALAKRWLGVNP